MKLDGGLSSDEEAEVDAQQQAQLAYMRWRAELREFSRLTPWRALRRIFCPHSRTGGMINEDMRVEWCYDCGHTEVDLAPLAPHPLLPDGKPAWSSS